MQKRLKKIILYIAFLVMLIMAGYVIFVSSHAISNKYYFLITAASFVLVCAVFLIFVFNHKMNGKKSIKLMLIICIALIAFQVITFPIVNIFSQSLPAWPPRGTIYQFPGYRNSIAQNDVGLMMRYYLDGKTVYAASDYPRDSHNGNLFITNEYEFIKSEYPIISSEYAKMIENEFKTIHVQENPKLMIFAFKIYLSNEDSKEMVIIKDELDSWYLMPLSFYEEAFGE